MRNHLVLFGLLLAACGQGVNPEAPEAVEPPVQEEQAPAPGPLTLEQRLKAEDLTVLAIATAESNGLVEARQVQTQPNFTPIPVRATAGKLAAHVTTRAGVDVLALDKLIVPLADVTLLDTGLTLANLQLEMRPIEAAPVTWSAGKAAASATLKVQMRVSGSTRGDNGATAPFETQVFEDVELELRLFLDANTGLSASFKSHGDHTPSWHWVDLLETGPARFEGLALEKQDSASTF
jgi:hypothetical protein